MKKVFQYLITMMALPILLVSCEKPAVTADEPDTPVPDTPEEETVLKFECGEPVCTPTSFTVEIKTNDPDKTWYAAWNTEQQWRQWTGADGQFDQDLLMASELDYIDILASTSGTSRSEILKDMLYTGDQTISYSRYVEPGTKCYLYYFGWDASGEFTTDLGYIEIDIPELVMGDAQASISVTNIDSRNMTVSITVGQDIRYAYKVFAYKETIDGFLAGGDADAMAIELAQSIIETGTPISEGTDTENRIVDPGVDYTVCVAGYDVAGEMFLTRKDCRSMDRETPSPVDSPLFSQLAGSSWNGTQTLNTQSGAKVTYFTATVEDSEWNWSYRKYNQLAIKLMDFGGMTCYGAEILSDSYGMTELEAMKIYGPKLVITIDENDQMTIDATEYQDYFCGWSSYGTLYMMGYDGSSVSGSRTLKAELSDDGNTITISDPSGNGSYPSVMVYAGDRWDPIYWGISDIVLTRNTSATTGAL